MNILVSLSSYRRFDEKHLSVVMDTYAAQFTDCTVDYVVALNYSSSLAFPLNTVFTTGSFDGGKFLWTNADYISQHCKEYDYIIHSDADIQITRANFDYYATESRVVTGCQIAGFLVVETVSGSNYLINNSPLLPQITGKHTINGKPYITPYNPHSCCYIIEASRYRPCEPYRWKGLDFNDVAMSRFYIEQTKVVNVEAALNGDALVTHLPNKYWNHPTLNVPTVESLKAKLNG